MSKVNKDLKKFSIQIGEDLFRERDCWRHVVVENQNGLQTSRKKNKLVKILNKIVKTKDYSEPRSNRTEYSRTKTR